MCWINTGGRSPSGPPGRDPALAAALVGEKNSVPQSSESLLYPVDRDHQFLLNCETPPLCLCREPARGQMRRGVFMGDAIGGSSSTTGGVRTEEAVDNDDDEMEGVICNYENGHWSFC